MRNILAVSLALCLTTLSLLQTVAAASPLAATGPLPQDYPQDNSQGNYSYQPFAPEQLDNLLAPIALYPDPLLAQVLPAATFVDQVQQAAGWVQSNGLNGIDGQYWDVSVKAVAHYPMVIQMMASRIDWTTSIGQAYVNQSTDVMTSIQRLRASASSQGNLYSTPQQQVLNSGGYIQIVPAQPQYIYVPTYDPAVVYVRPHREAVAIGAVIGFGAGLMIGAWLSRDVDWHQHRVYYDGWQGGDGGGWRGRSRQYVQVNNTTYVNNTYNNVTVNKTVVNRTVNVTNINNYNSVHRNVTYNNVVHNNTVVKNNPGNNQRAIVNPGARPGAQPGYRPPVTGTQPGYRPPVTGTQPGYRPPERNVQPGYRPPVTAAQPGYRPPATGTPSGYHPPAPGTQPGYRPPERNVQPGYRPPVTATQPGYHPPAAGTQPAYHPPATGAQPGYRPPVTGAQPAYHPPANQATAPRPAQNNRVERPAQKQEKPAREDKEKPQH